MRHIAPEGLRTTRLRLSPLAVEDAAAMVGVLSDPALYSYTGGVPPTFEALVRQYESQVAGSGRDDELWLNWVLRTGDDGAAIGFVQATVTGEEADVAWVIGVDSQGEGYAKEAVAAMTRWLVAAGVRRLYAHIHPDHRASQSVAASVGLVRTSEIDDEGEEVWSTV